VVDATAIIFDWHASMEDIDDVLDDVLDDDAATMIR